MPRFYIPSLAWNPERLALDATESHHAFDVLRMKAGDRATVFDGEGHEAEVELMKQGKSGTELRKISLGKSAPLPCRITLAQAVPKGKNMELIIEKATELGVGAIAPLMSERTIVRGSEDDHVRKQAKWQRTAVEACKQCGQNFLPRVTQPCTPRALFERNEKFDLMLIGSLQGDAIPLKRVLAETGAKRPRSVLILIGPEGDFTPAEVSLAKSQGCRPVTLGPIILRTETAAIYTVSVLNHELQSAAQ
ncbi:MAG: 16S rRNA (uracil(1498)-N(3))-methyltransferase [Chthoniobacteraceae bacterium]